MATGQDPELVFTSVSLDRDSSRDLELTSLVMAASWWQCCTIRLNTARNVAKSRASSACRRSSRNMSSVRSGYSADWESGVWLGCQTGPGGDNLGHGDRQHCGQWRRQRLLATSDTAQPVATDCWLTGSASIDAARSMTTTWLARTGTTMGTRCCRVGSRPSYPAD